MAFSRTNRILGETKSQGNIVCFRNLKTAADDAIALFSDPKKKDKILMGPYEEYIEKFNEAFVELVKIAPSVNSVDAIIDEEEQLKFIRAFRDLMRVRNVLEGFADFDWNDLSMEEQIFEDYKSKYLDLYEQTKSRTETEKVSVLKEVDFELELIHKDEINVSYILKLLAKYRKAKADEQEKQRDTIVGIINAQPGLRSKRELIEKFIDDHLMHIEDDDLIDDAFEKFWDEEQVKAFDALCEEENLNKTEVNKVIDTYLYDGRSPLKDDIANTLKVKPKLLERKKIVPRVLEKIMGFVDKFYDGGVGMGSGSEKAVNSGTYADSISGNAMMAAEETSEYTGRSTK